MTDASLVLLERFYNAFAANAAKEYLESQGILAFVFDENVNNLGFYQFAIGGVRLMVTPSDFENARNLLATLPTPGDAG